MDVEHRSLWRNNVVSGVRVSTGDTWLVIHVPDPPLHMYHLFENSNLRDSQYDAMLRSTIRVLCKPHPGIKRFCIKQRPKCTIMMKDISRLLPDICSSTGIVLIQSYLGWEQCIVRHYLLLYAHVQMLNGFQMCVHTLKTFRDITLYQNSKSPKRCKKIVIPPVCLLTFVIFYTYRTRCDVKWSRHSAS